VEAPITDGGAVVRVRRSGFAECIGYRAGLFKNILKIGIAGLRESQHP
jgi:hypothetical protein